MIPANIQYLNLRLKDGKFFAVLRFYRFMAENFWDFLTGTHFVHMAHYFVILLAPPSIINRKIYLWYAHMNVSITLRIAEMISGQIFSPTKSSFRLKSKKVIHTGHGIDFDKISMKESSPSTPRAFVTFSRIGRVKNIHMAIEFIVKRRMVDNTATLDIFGGPITNDDKKYLKEIEALALKYSDFIFLRGHCPYNDILKTIKNYDMGINFSDTGSLDKAIIETLAAGIPVLTSNDVGSEIRYELKGVYYVPLTEVVKSANNLETWYSTCDPKEIRGTALAKHSQKNTIEMIIAKIHNHQCQDC